MSLDTSLPSIIDWRQDRTQCNVDIGERWLGFIESAPSGVIEHSTPVNMRAIYMGGGTQDCTESLCECQKCTVSTHPNLDTRCDDARQLEHRAKIEASSFTIHPICVVPFERALVQQDKTTVP
jgi:hypothetical protein